MRSKCDIKICGHDGDVYDDTGLILDWHHRDRRGCNLHSSNGECEASLCLLTNGVQGTHLSSSCSTLVVPIHCSIGIAGLLAIEYHGLVASFDARERVKLSASPR